MDESDDRIQRSRRRTDADDLSLAQIARGGVMFFGFAIALTGIVLVVLLFNAVHGLVFDDASGLKAIFEMWREIVVPEGFDPQQYDTDFPVTTVVTYVAMWVPILFLGRLAIKVVTTGIKIATLKDPNRE